MGDILIRDLTTYSEFLQVREVQRTCFGFSGDEGLYPPILLTASQNGGTVLGAFDGEQMVAYLFGFLGLHQNRAPLKVCSQTMGVLPDYRGRGIAEALKWAQRDRATRLGLKLITWTYDPLEMPNARLNIAKLGGLVRRYRRNIYGEQFGQLNMGLPTDRFVVEWRLDSPRVEEFLAGTHRPPEGAVQEIMVRDLQSGKERQLTNDRKNIDEVCWTTGGLILFSSNRGVPRTSGQYPRREGLRYRSPGGRVLTLR